LGRRNIAAILFVALTAGVVLACLSLPVGQWLSVDSLERSRDWLSGLVQDRPLFWGSLFFCLCVIATALCFPAAPILGISGGALFGFWPGLVIVTIASSIGSTIAFFDSRYLLRDWVRRRLGRRACAIDESVEKHGALYLLVLRLNPLVPYWLVNLAMGLTAMRPATYVPLTVAGLTPATFVYVQFGSAIAVDGTGPGTPSLPLLVALFVVSVVPVYLRLLARFEPRA
jgi:uncharacterized membrane protein YdjX (TVP38/TMEM64 family)